MRGTSKDTTKTTKIARLYLLCEPKTKKKLHAKQGTRTTREATDFCATFFIMKTTGGRYRRLYMGIFQRLDKFPRFLAMKGCDSL